MKAYVIECAGQSRRIDDEPTVDDALQVALGWLKEHHDDQSEATFSTERDGVRTAAVVMVADREGGWGFGAKIKGDAQS